MSSDKCEVGYQGSPQAIITDVQRSDDARAKEATEQHHRSQVSDNHSTQCLHRATTEVLSVHHVGTLVASAPHNQRIQLRDFVRIFPAEIVYQIFEPLGFYDFVTCTQVSAEWNIVLMESVWPQQQEYFFSLYPLLPLLPHQKTAIVKWLQGNYQFMSRYEPPGAFRNIRNQLERNNYLRYRHRSQYITYLNGPSGLVLYEIEMKIATIEALTLQSSVSPKYAKDLFLRLASCRQLKKLEFRSNLMVHTVMDLGKQPRLSINHLNINLIVPFIHTTSAHIDILKEIFLLCPLLRELVLRFDSYWDGSIHQILRFRPSTLSAFTLHAPDYARYSQIIVPHTPTSYARSFKRLSIDLRSSRTDWQDLHEAIASVSGTIEILCIIFPDSEDLIISRGRNISSMAETFRRCHKLHAAHIQCGSMENVILKAMSHLPGLECIHFKLSLTSGPGELLSFFNGTNACIKKIYLDDFDIDDNILRAISRFTSLQLLKVSTAFPFPELSPKYSDDMIKELMTRNPQLKRIHTDSEWGDIHLEAHTSD